MRMKLRLLRVFFSFAALTNRAMFIFFSAPSGFLSNGRIHIFSLSIYSPRRSSGSVLSARRVCGTPQVMSESESADPEKRIAQLRVGDAVQPRIRREIGFA